MIGWGTASRVAGPPGGGWLWSASLGGAVTMFLVQPPADLWWLAWLAPLPWLAIVAAPLLPGRRPWLILWCAGFVHWLAAIHWLRLPHPATSIGWVALAAYLGIYLPLFVWTARRLVHRRRWRLVPAATVAWVAGEQVRGWVLGGFTFAGLGHTQWRWTTLIQSADAVGAVGVGGVVMAVAAGLAALAAGRGRLRESLPDAAAGAAALGLALAYGSWRIAEEPVDAGKPLDVLLVQGSIDTELKHDPDAAADVARHYDELTQQGLLAGGTVRPDLVVWPETMWRWGLVDIDPAETIDETVVERMLGPASPAADEKERSARQARCRAALAKERLDALARFARRYACPWLVGLDRQVITPRVPGGAEHFNSALFLDASGEPLACYDKMHPVMFGEYLPLADRFPLLYRLTPLPAGLTAGRDAVVVTIAGRDVAPTICYETALPGAIRGLVRNLQRRGRRPDVLVNLTNDGWFWGSSELDMHLTAAIFRAVEIRTPIVIAANTGFSASIDGSGRLLARGPRRAPTTIRAAVRADGRTSPWMIAGSLPAWLCVAVAGLVAIEWRPGRGPGPSGVPAEGADGKGFEPHRVDGRSRR